MIRRLPPTAISRGASIETGDADRMTTRASPLICPGDDAYWRGGGVL